MHLPALIGVGVFATLVGVTCGNAVAGEIEFPHEQNACELERGSSDECVVQVYERLDAQLNDLYGRLRRVLAGSVDEGRLRDAQRAWLKYAQDDCVYEAGTEEQAAAEQPSARRRCMSGHLFRRIEKLKRYLPCESEDCDSEIDVAPMPTAVETLLLGRPTVIHLSATGVYRKRTTGAFTRLVDGATIQPGDELLFRTGGGFQVNGQTILPGDGAYWMQVRQRVERSHARRSAAEPASGTSGARGGSRAGSAR